jgi:hypothetical protein
MPDGSKYDVPAEVIARSRALNYSDGDESCDEYRNEYDFTIKDPYELKDWAANNMNWSDVQDYAVKAMEPNLGDFQEGWMNGEKEIVEY